MRKADEHDASAALLPAAAAARPPAAAAATRDTTTIGRYIARFRYEQPLPREKRVGVQKEDFWWKSSGDSPSSSHRRSRLRQQKQQQPQSAPEPDSKLDASSLSGSSVVSSSVTSGYERYIPELHHHEHEASDRKASNSPATAPIVSLGRDKSPVPPANSALNSDRGGALLLSSLSVSWDSVPSDLEPPSSSSDHAAALQELTRPRSHQREHTQENHVADRHRLYTTAYGEARAMKALVQDEEQEQDEEAKVEDAELVIERVRKRLGWSSSGSNSGGLSDHSLSFQYDAPSPSPRHTKWRLSHGSVDNEFSPFSAAAMASSLARSAGDDNVLSGTMRRMSDETQSLELVLSELSSSEDVRRSLTALEDAVEFYSTLRTEDSTMDERIDHGELLSYSPRGSLVVEASDAAAKTHVLDFEPSNDHEEDTDQRSEDGVTQPPPPEARHDTASELSGTDKIGTAARIPAAKAREEPSVEANATPSANQTEEAQDPQETAILVPLRSVESPVLPLWRRDSGSRSSSPITTTLSPSPTSLSSQSSVTAETAETLNGLVSLVVQSWSNDFFFGGGGGAEADNSDEYPKEDTVAKSLERKEGTSDDDLEDETAEPNILLTHEEVETVDSPHGSASQVNSTSVALVEPIAVPPITADDSEPSADAVSIDAVEETQEEAEMKEDEDDEIVRLLLARIVLYEQALRQLDEETTTHT